MKTLAIGVVGAGRLGGFHAQKLAARPDVRLVGVADPIEDSRNRVAAQCGCRAFARTADLAELVDAVVIAAPTRMHRELGVEFLSRRKHVLMEKPLATTAAEADDLVQLARRNGLVLQVGHVERFNPAWVAAGPYLRQAKYIEGVRSGPFSFRSTDVGAVLDLMIHDIDLVLSLVRAPVKQVEAIGLSVLGGHEDVANARIHFEGGAIAVLSACRVSYEPARRMQVWTPRGFAAIDFATRTTSLIQPSERLLQRKLELDALSPDELEHLRQHLAEEHLPRQQWTAEAVDALALELEDFVDSIRTPRVPRVSGLQGRDAVALAEQILGQIGTHAWDDRADGPTGPLALPRTAVIPAPHFVRTPLGSPQPKRAAG